MQGTIEQPKTNIASSPEGLRQRDQTFHGIDVSNLPSHATLTFVKQSIDPNASSHRLALGDIMMSERPIPLWAHLASSNNSCEVRIRYGTGNAGPEEQHDQFALVEPFSYLTTEPLNTKHAMLESLVVYYFVTAGKWRKFPLKGKVGQVCLAALKQACKKVDSGIATAHGRKHQSPSSEAESVPGEFAHSEKRKHDDAEADSPDAKRIVTATSKERLLEAEVNAKEDQIAEMINIVGRALSMAMIHYNWASDILDGKRILAEAQGSAILALEGDGEELKTMVSELEVRWGRKL